MLQAASTGIIAKANADRPSGVDTTIITRVQGEWAAYQQKKNDQTTQQSDATTERAQRDVMVESIQDPPAEDSVCGGGPVEATPAGKFRRARRVQAAAEYGVQRLRSILFHKGGPAERQAAFFCWYRPDA